METTRGRRDRLKSTLSRVIDVDLAKVLDSRQAFEAKVKFLAALEELEVEEHRELIDTVATSMAHEMRNPLNSAHLQLAVARRRLARGELDQAVLDGVDQADGQMTRLAEIVDQLVALGRPEALEVKRADLGAIATAAVALLAPHAADVGVSLSLDDGADVWTHVDPTRMTRAVAQLVHHAIDATGEGGAVRVSAAAIGEVACIRVEDDGRYCSRQGRVREPFLTSTDPAAGLKLAVVHRTVTDHGGVVEVARHQHRTVHTISLPRTGSASAPPPVTTARAEG